MTYIDTHAHLYAEQFDEDRAEMIQRAIDSGVKKLFLPNIDLASIPKMEQLVEDYPGICYSMMGIHPCDVAKDWEKQLEETKKHYKKGRHIAIGEIGIDLYWDKTLQAEQTASFRAQINWAKEEELPIVIHCRDAFDEIFEVLDQENDERLFGVFHCFTGTEEQAKRILNYGGFKLGIGGVVTFKNSGVDKAIQNIALEDLVLETDAPYLSPTPFRGKRNESSYIPLIAKKLSDIYGISEEKVGEITTKNALEVFTIKA
ncbi:TatD family hydrolase [Brumimicrobium aurantiacum]|uniref:TatD family deoxyribonuclease n=1 Tax=Brumimicrobium aurantiacum TaxID=1737063 RepID=A0A3E1F1A4_9FLAO|nr:TatD family hydrolase [Brumimicrobium aurantiacum]RFC55590.1 TatD family deoxyribonuclease [Brumimicrobium aurantiacum]